MLFFSHYFLFFYFYLEQSHGRLLVGLVLLSTLTSKLYSTFHNFKMALHDFLNNVCSLHQNKLKIVHLNAQSLQDTAHQAEFFEIFASVELDVIIVSETWLKNNTVINLPNYKSFYAYRKSKNGGGVAVFVKSCYSAKVLSISTGDYDKPDYLLLEVQAGSHRFLLASVYRRPKGGFLEIFQDELLKFMANFKYVFVCGDINARFGSGSEETRIITDMLSFCNLVSVPFGPTYHTESCDSKLDIISSNCPELLVDFGQTAAPGFSAHDLIYAAYDLSVPHNCKQTITFRKFKNVKKEDLLADIESAPWKDVYEAADMDGKLNQFNTIITKLMDKHAPIVTATVSTRSQPWMTADIKKLMSRRDKLRNKFFASKSPEDKEDYRKQRNLVKQTIRNAKTRFLYSQFECDLDTRDMWKRVRSLNIGKTQTQNNEPVIPVEQLNNHYASVSSIRCQQLTMACMEEYADHTTAREINDKFFFKYVTPTAITSAINSINSNAKGVDCLPIAFIKLCMPCIVPVLEYLFNFSLQNSIFPAMWKKANILPIPKVKNPAECKDYRPVSILCVLGKALEKIVHAQVSEFIEANNLYPQQQSGFRKGRSTTTALLKVVDDLRASMDKRLMNLLVLLDLSKAFDCVHHELLMVKLKFLGFSDSTIEWFKSYLIGRSHRVFVSEILHSNWSFINTGVPQGSVLGPLLFTLYLFDLPSYIKNCSYHMFADDVQMYIPFSLHNFIDKCDLMVDDVTRVIDYCNKHNLVLNVTKTQAITIGSQRYLTKLTELGLPQSITVNNCVVNFSKTVKNLGIVFDTTLSWNEHCIHIAQKIFGILAQLKRNFVFLPPKIRLTLVKALAFPHIDYGSVLFTDMSMCNNKKLQKLQNACIRFISGARVYEHVTPIFNELGILKINHRRHYHTALLIWKVIVTETPCYLFQQFKFTADTNVRNTRSNRRMLQIPIHRMEKFHNSFTVKAAKLWNDLKLYDCMSLTIPAFKRRIERVCLLNQLCNAN